MKYLQIILIGIVVSLSIKSNCLGQEVVSSAGDTFNAHERTLSWTIGEVITETIGNDNSITQGFHQPNLTVTSIYMYKLLEREISLFPNPVMYELNISVNAESEEYNVVIFDDLGGVSYSKKLTLGNTPTLIDFNNYVQGVYFVRVVDLKGLVLQTFKIIKN